MVPEKTDLRLFFQDLLAGIAELFVKVFVRLQEILGLFFRLFDQTGLFEQAGNVMIVLRQLFLGETKLRDIIIG